MGPSNTVQSLRRGNHSWEDREGTASGLPSAWSLRTDACPPVRSVQAVLPHRLLGVSTDEVVGVSGLPLQTVWH
jgi:hypothetical protein